ncbi:MULTISPECIES: alpha-amylase [Rahnella]|jgi:alpha-amylase|uniref:Alpha-amylase n=1 Tax=Rahnella victoriana TaxID=1510570 RepID=A0ABS0DX13_9GAMM|nr:MULTISPECIES: alpha-amylase [Rahnella]PKB89631.1 alpha-amylase [Ewingella americana]MBF7957522.1 alpha-amylase [Rahnella victoriana]PBI78073.1 alpha-amylase [Rahnella victoriana]TDS97847.1 alpha-amylase [Rahnella sp. BIGb0236]UHM93396.1 alpha-amylase [Rahnella victoriana]
MQNPTLFQFFHWYYPDGGKLWPEVAEKAAWLAETGITAVWLPPAYKGDSGGYSVGYDTYDLFDLGEFDQKGSRATKYGDKEGLLAAISALKTHQLGVILDVVLNHKMGADEKERVQVNRVNIDNREDISDDIIEADAWTRFIFAARNGQHSEFIWDYHCFSGVDHIENPDEQGIFKIINDYTGGGWNDQVDDEFGNYDYLMGANVDFRNKAVDEELKYWARWLMEQTQCSGFRLDAVKHIPAWFYKDWIDHIQEVAEQPMFIVAEYWSHDVPTLQNYIDQVEGKTLLFDAPLQLNFHHASKQGADYNLSTVFDNTLVAADPAHAVTLVANHDTQPLQSLEAPIEPWFKPLAYALILLREQGVPIVFYPDLLGATYEDEGDDGNSYTIDMPVIPGLETLIRARQTYAWGAQTDYLDHPNCIAFARSGTAEHPGCVVVMSNSEAGEKTLELGEHFAHKKWRDLLENRQDIVESDGEGKALFYCDGGSVSVWVLTE